MKTILLVSTALAGLMLASAGYAQNATGTGTSNSNSTSGSTSGAQGVVGPQGNAINAGTSNANAGSNSNANTRSNSRASSSGNANAQQIQFNSPGQTTSNNTNNSNSTNRNSNANTDAVSYSGGTNSYSRNDGDVTVRTTPTVYAPPVSGGNPCTLAVSGGVSVIGWGAAAGGTFVDTDCANRQKIAMIHNSGRPDLAFALMCNDRDTYNASKSTTQPCPIRPAWEAPGAPMPAQAPILQGPAVVTPVTAPMAPVAAKNYVRCNPRAGIVDNCVSG